MVLRDDGEVDTASIDIAAPPEAVYDLVADVTNMGRWSPETYRCKWLDDDDGPRTGARFKGWNRQKVGPLPLQWSTTCTVAAAERPGEFAFDVRQSGARWTYRFEPAGDGGTRVTETREDGQKPLPAKVFSAVVPGRPELLRKGMQETLERIKAAAEARPS